ncbi:GVP36 [Candida oxycetoniae]|uniref:GVP36 n=1 Tax=Candida oxycetoniae TaxID=497107 RepID=A0AAI9WX99_9ASCO|nr:GVP36 [Candida oxycetoniae]KAI3403535.2 GVP36 [Candida oxycetoniae]
MSFNFANFTKDLKSFGDKISSDFNKEVLPMAQRTQRMVQEKIGKISKDEISQLPKEYTELAQRCNNIESLYKNILKVTTNYENESYDYPTNLQESFSEFSHNITTRFNNLSKATTTAEAQAALVKPNDDQFRTPKTMYHALSRATDASILTNGENEAATSARDEDPLIKGLDLYSCNLNKIANARIGQDQLIKQKFNIPLKATLRSLISQSNNIQKKVESKRIDYDLARYNLTQCTNPTKESKLRVDMENAEDEFANTVEDAINIMQNVVENAKPLLELLNLIEAQLAYHKLASELLGGMVGQFEELIDEQNKKSGNVGSNTVEQGKETGEFDI